MDNQCGCRHASAAPDQARQRRPALPRQRNIHRVVVIQKTMTSKSVKGLPRHSANHARKLLHFLEERKKSLTPLLILTHDFPDPDAIASALALQHLAQSAFGIESKIAYGGIVGRMENRIMVRTLRIHMHRFHPVLLKRHPHVALVDTQPVFKNNPFPASRKAALVLDQHPSDTPPEAGLAIVDPDCGATCVLVAQALLLAGIGIPARVATALAYGILTDTLELYRARRPDVAKTYLQVLQHADMRALARIQNPVLPRKYFSVLGQGIRGRRAIPASGGHPSWCGGHARPRLAGGGVPSDLPPRAVVFCHRAFQGPGARVIAHQPAGRAGGRSVARHL